MTMKPILLGLTGLLAACGGSGTSAVDPIAEPDPVPFVDPDTITFVLSNSEQVPFAISEDAFVYDGERYEFEDAQRRYVDEGNAGVVNSIRFAEGSVEGFGGARIVDGNAQAAVGILIEEAGPEYVRMPHSAIFSVPTLSGTPTGTATFDGKHVSFLVARNFGGFAPSSSTIGEDGVSFSGIFSDATLTVEFAENLSDSTFSGLINNRRYRLGERNDFVNFLNSFDDVVISNGRIDDSGQITADLSGGIRLLNDPNQIAQDRFAIEPGTLIGQLGGENGSVIAGTTEIEHSRFGFDENGQVRDEIVAVDTELGAFFVR